MQLHPSSAFILESIAFAADGDDVAVVEQAVEDGCGHHDIGKDRTPLRDGTVMGDEEAATLVATRDQLEEEMGGIGLEGQRAQLVDDQQPWLGKVDEPFFEPVFQVRLGKADHQCGGCGKQHAVASDNGFSTRGDGQMGFADAGRP